MLVTYHISNCKKRPVEWRFQNVSGKRFHPGSSANFKQNKPEHGLAARLPAHLSPSPLTSILRSRRGLRKAPECLHAGHICVRSRELLKAGNRRFYKCSPFAEICPRFSSTLLYGGQEGGHRLNLPFSARAARHHGLNPVCR